MYAKTTGRPAAKTMASLISESVAAAAKTAPPAAATAVTEHARAAAACAEFFKAAEKMADRDSLEAAFSLAQKAVFPAAEAAQAAGQDDDALLAAGREAMNAARKF